MLATITLTASTPVAHVARASAAVRLQTSGPLGPEATYRRAAPAVPRHELRTAHRLTAEIARVRAVALARAHSLGTWPQVARAERVDRSPAFLRWELHLWQRRAQTYHRLLIRRADVSHPTVSSSTGIYAALLCIHRYEGAWNDDTGNGYYGGLQMSPGFMEAYGSEFVRRYGVASNWPPAVQLEVAYRAVESVGYSPWPSTRVACGV